MFGLGKRERARKQLNVAVEVFLAGQREMQQGIFATMADKADALAGDVAEGEMPTKPRRTLFRHT